MQQASSAKKMNAVDQSRGDPASINYHASAARGEYLNGDAPRTDSHLNQANNEQLGSKQLIVGMCRARIWNGGRG